MGRRDAGAPEDRIIEGMGMMQGGPEQNGFAGFAAWHPRRWLGRSRLSDTSLASEDEPSRILPYEFGALILLAALAMLVATLALEVQNTATAYTVGEMHWSRSQDDAVRALTRYVRSADARDLQDARAALAIPMGDRAARLALESSPADVATARAGFEQGGNARQDLERIVRAYRFLRDAPYFRDAVGYWREGDAGVLELLALADLIESSHRQGGPDPGQIAEYDRQIRLVATRTREVARAFSASLGDGVRVLNRMLAIASILVFMFIVIGVVALLSRTLHRIRSGESVFRGAFHRAAVGMLKMDRHGRILDANARIAAILGYSVTELRQLRLQDVLEVDDLARLGRDSSGGIDWIPQTHAVEQRFLRSDGTPCWVRWSVSVVNPALARQARVFAIVEDISMARELRDEMAYQATHDALTGLINRREIETRLRGMLESSRQGKRNAFCFLDLDQFKLINDSCGHAAGDQLLRQLADVLLPQLRSTDSLGRLGGDEFAILLEDTDIDASERIAERTRQMLAGFVFLWEERKFNVTCSIGIVVVGGDEQDVMSILRAADRACYLAKEDGRNCIRIYKASDEAIARRRDEMAWIDSIRKALAEQRIVLYAQRIEALSGSPGLRYEVLVRLIDCEGEIHTPEVFMRAAERYGEALAIDRQVVSLAYRELAENPLHVHELDLCHINVSAQSIANAEFRAHVAGLLDLGQVPPEKFCFELTETAAIGNLVQARHFIDEMRGRGCKIALDDFGSGLSSFAYLRNLPVDVLKIDGIFVRHLESNEIDAVLVRSICEIAHFLGKTTIAECVENRLSQSRLRELGVDLVQGFAIHQPAPLVELTRQAQATRLPITA